MMVRLNIWINFQWSFRKSLHIHWNASLGQLTTKAAEISFLADTTGFPPQGESDFQAWFNIIYQNQVTRRYLHFIIWKLKCPNLLYWNKCAWSRLGLEFYYKIPEAEYLNSKPETSYQGDIPKPDLFYLYFICTSSSVKSQFSQSELLHILCKWNDIMVPIGSWVKLTRKEFNYIHY